MQWPRSDFGSAVAIIALGAVSLIGMSLALIGFSATRLMGEELLFGSSVLIILAAVGLRVLAPEFRT